MKPTTSTTTVLAGRAVLVALGAALLLTACGEDTSSSASNSATAYATQSVTMSLPANEALPAAQPTFHAAPVLLAPPSDVDQADPSGSAELAPHTEQIPAEFALLSTRRLTRQVLDEVHRTGIIPEAATAAAQGTQPLTAGATVVTYTPAQIRAAYGLPALPASGTTPTSAQIAQMGGGQTIYIVDAYDDPNAAAELATFNSKFGLPTCTTTTIAPNAALPLAAAPTTGCTFSVVYATGAGQMTATEPAYDSGWATEIALDVQWAHATAPYARIILIEAANPGDGSLVAGSQLANSMGPGVVSQSFGGAEVAGLTAQYDSNYQAPNMTYLAAAGDAGTEVEWPSVSAHVLAVGGLSLTYSAGASRTETVWSGTGGGVSAYTPAPPYQQDAVTGLAKATYRQVSDVSFNADPNTGQYVVVIPQGSTTPEWGAIGGTSLATPQWAGIVAIANAVRAQSKLAPLGDAHAALYQIGTSASSYESEFLDITQGSDGTCATCFAGVGYDLPSGLGSPNVTSLLTSLSSAPAAVAPTVKSATVSGKVGTALSFQVTASGADALAYSVADGPPGLSINPTSGLVTWASPAAGSYSLTAIATDTKTGLAGSGTITISIVQPATPVVAATTISGTAYTALNFTVQATDTYPDSFTLSGAPSGMTVTAAGVVSWATPLQGTYPVTVNAIDKTDGLTGSGVYTVKIAAPAPPGIANQAVSGTAGKALSYKIIATSADPLSFSLGSAPAGLTVSSAGTLSWPNPVAGSYSVPVTVTDTDSGQTAKATLTLTIQPAGPQISASAMTGSHTKAFSGSFTVTDATSSTLKVTVSGMPSGMTLSGSAGTVTLSWAKPVAGSYKLSISVVDGNGAQATASVGLTIT